MLSPKFLRTLEDAKPGDRITGVIAWNVFADTHTAAEVMKMLADIKTPVLTAAVACEGVRVNPLDGMPQAIVDAPVESWRAIIAKNDQLADENNEDVIVQANTQIFSTF